MACIDAPEKKQDLGIASRDYLRSLLNTNPEKLVVMKKDKDRYGRTVAEVFIGLCRHNWKFSKQTEL
jgi:endonuclease YncB( thermonuclease family)